MTTNDVVTAFGGVSIPAEITWAGRTSSEYVVELTAAYSPDFGRYVARKIVVNADEGSEVTSEGLHAVPVAGLLRMAVADRVAPLFAPMFHNGPPAGLADAGPTTETLQWVSRIYRLALLLGDAPTNAVASALGVPRSTAGRWATRARDRGFLPVVDPRGGAKVGE